MRFIFPYLFQHVIYDTKDEDIRRVRRQKPKPKQTQTRGRKSAPIQFVTCGKNAPRKLKRASKTKCVKRNRKLAAHALHGTDFEFTQVDYEPYKCAQCDFKCRRKGDLYHHTSRHSAEDPYKCNLCSYRTTTISHLLSHKLTHVKKEVHKSHGGASVECSLCDYKTSCGSLKKHMKAFGYSCNETGVLKTYMSDQNDDKPFKCTVCNYKCKWSGTLKKHFTSEHAKS